jgi:hypothetical protein
LFFPAGDPIVSILLTFAVFGVGFVMRHPWPRRRATRSLPTLGSRRHTGLHQDRRTR